MTKPRVRVSLPNEGWVHRSVASVVYDQWLHDPRFEISIDDREAKPVDNARNQHVKRFLADGCEWFLMIDSDNPPVSGVDILAAVERDLDVVVFPTPMWWWGSAAAAAGAWPIIWNGMMFDSALGSFCHVQRPVGLTEIDAGGTGCMLVARRVLEAVRPAFVREYDADGVQARGSDLAFCMRAREAGFRVWCDWDRPCSHFKEVDLAEVSIALHVRDISQANEIQAKPTDWSQREERILPFYPALAEFARGKRALDFGCGRGDLLAMLGETAIYALGIDCDHTAVETCRSRGLAANVGSHPPEAPFDVAFCTEVLEHVEDDRALLQELLAVAPTVIYSVPANCLPPRIEPEHRRVYKIRHIEAITQAPFRVIEWEWWYVVIASLTQDVAEIRKRLLAFAAQENDSQKV